MFGRQRHVASVSETTRRSAGILLYRFAWGGNDTRHNGAEIEDPGRIDPIAEGTDGRHTAGDLQVYLVHPGGPYFTGKDVWGIAKGLIEDGEDERSAARREFTEETGIDAPTDLTDLGTVTTHRGKVIHGFAGLWPHGDDPPPVRSNTCPVQWPPHSGIWIDVPEVDEGRFFAIDEIRERMHGCQSEFLDRLEELLILHPGERPE